VSPGRAAAIASTGAALKREQDPVSEVLAGGSYRDRTDDIHGVNVALYQLS
jgi:hypothetical protein